MVPGLGVPAVFMGEYQHTIDEKGRVTMPARFREDLAGKFVTTKGLDKCLFVYPINTWAIIQEKIKKLPFTRADARAFTRVFLAGACECELDAQGRVLIPPSLREYAHLEKEVVIIGVSERIEIWSKREWDSYCQRADEDYEELAEKIVDFWSEPQE